ncbi:phosphoribosylglycinamide formyltransferase [Anaerococcus sp.]|uniref:phosphoribosylglycinamide formyltransferase n=1 Tax=Anaerococcus sp. TaxID=1872515 RepID=UPI00258DF984|nr:phosphoribosylglycinamide formyltransferase [Anaerococcus sp.]MDU3211520.1 phosphoribosylglycinamide formyltransferase [Anaerococcus sp.]
MNLAVFISGTGTNLKALIDAQNTKYFTSQINIVVSNKNAKGLEYARSNNIRCLISKDDDEIIDTLKKYDINLIVLAGYLVKVSKKILDEFTVINIHPSLLPKYGGKGFYGMNVHNAVFDNKEKISGVTVHYVNENLDDGDIILQKKVDVSKCTSAEEISKEVLKAEHKTLREVIRKLEEEKCAH